jgi:hypothetical protein
MVRVSSSTAPLVLGQGRFCVTHSSPLNSISCAFQKFRWSDMTIGIAARQSVHRMFHRR